MPPDTRKRIAAGRLRGFVERALVAVGVPWVDATIVADCLLMANLSGVDSHGVVRLSHYVQRIVNGTIKAEPNVSHQHPAPSLALLDGDDGLGHVVTFGACTEAMAMARETGIGMVAIRNSSHFGMTGFYIYRLVQQGFIGMAMTDTDAFLIPFGGRQPFFGTNPLAIGFPTRGIPIILDMATTSVPYGKIALAKAEGLPIPPDWGLDSAGDPTTDPNAVVGLHPIAGPKGSGLAMVIDILCSVLTGLAWGPNINKMYEQIDEPRRIGHVIMAIDAQRLMPIEAFTQRLDEMLQAFHDVPPAEGHQQVYYPGELEGLRRRERSVKGIPIDAGLEAELTALGERLGVAF